jgi:lipopolysaccharide/colanic/teichoic acid biosynthesis glycosyltransferase
MAIMKTLNSLKARFGTDKLLGALRAEDQMRFFVEKERALCDRNSHQFSIIIFERCQNARRSREHLLYLTRALRQRLRLTDEVGWFDGKRIVTILPLTSEEGALRVAEDVRNLVRESSGGLETLFTVHTYPRHMPASDDHSQSGSRQSPLRADGGRASDIRIAAASVHGQCACMAPAAELEPVLPNPMPFWKRGMDVVGASVGLVLLAPLFAAVALLIKCVSKGPVFFKQERIGYLGKPFMCWKFRTMHMSNKQTVHQAHLSQLMKTDAPMTKLDARGDSRIIPLGGLLRKSCIDELPQLINVFLGEMSLIGPRPCVRYEANDYLMWHKTRFDAIPGMTGLWQVNGKNKTTFKQMIRFDINYARRLSFVRDVWILLMTLPTIVGQIAEGAVRKWRKENIERA